MTLHLPVRSGTIGHRDQWGFGDTAATFDYPSLGLKRMVFKTTTGGFEYPELFGVKPVFTGKPYYAPTLEWGRWKPTWYLPDGRVLVAIEHEVMYAFEEKEIDDDHK